MLIIFGFVCLLHLPTSELRRPVSRQIVAIIVIVRLKIYEALVES